MNNQLIFGLVLLFLVSSFADTRAEFDSGSNIFGDASGGNFLEEEGVIILNSANIEQALKEFKYLVIEFYAPWCGHCKKLQPEYNKAATTLKNQKSTVRLAKVDGNAENELLEKYKIEGFPTLKFFVDGKEEQYHGGRTEQSIIKWLKKSVP